MMIYLSKTGASIPFSEESYKEVICDQCVNAYRRSLRGKELKSVDKTSAAAYLDVIIKLRIQYLSPQMKLYSKSLMTGEEDWLKSWRYVIKKIMTKYL